MWTSLEKKSLEDDGGWQQNRCFKCSGLDCPPEGSFSCETCAEARAATPMDAARRERHAVADRPRTVGSDPYIRPAEYLYLSISVFPLETSIFLERLPLERERYIKKIARKTLDGELKQANTSDWHAQLVD